MQVSTSIPILPIQSSCSCLRCKRTLSDGTLNNGEREVVCTLLKSSSYIRTQSQDCTCKACIEKRYIRFIYIRISRYQGNRVISGVLQTLYFTLELVINVISPVGLLHVHLCITLECGITTTYVFGRGNILRYLVKVL